MPKTPIKINTCPFCGFPNVKVWSNKDGMWVKCLHCDALGPFIRNGTPGKAVKAWNERCLPTPIPTTEDDAVLDDELTPDELDATGEQAEPEDCNYTFPF